MKTYAHIYNGVVFEIILPATWQFDSEDPNDPFKAGDEIPTARRFTAAFIDACVDVTAVTPQPAQGWLYDGTSFSAPASVAG